MAGYVVERARSARPRACPVTRRSAARRAMTLDLLRFTTAGSVDDGKSTLIGRLLYDSKQVFEDQLEHVAAGLRAPRRRGHARPRAATDGLRAEREQGITIDVAYRYFATARPALHHRRLPRPPAVHAQHGHRASTADLAVVLLDARKGVLEQSKRHAFISALLGSRTSSSRSTRWTSSTTPRSASRSYRRVRGFAREAPRRQEPAANGDPPTSRSRR